MVWEYKILYIGRPEKQEDVCGERYITVPRTYIEDAPSGWLSAACTPYQSNLSNNHQVFASPLFASKNFLDSNSGISHS